ncbi:MAG TPA: N-acetylneuraminate synthase family protein [Candidatus Nanoarchaeia archaeon]|nr:N-acetylneuraminate synthase family protein [Candidatus Nanoarchaeia archaeon]
MVTRIKIGNRYVGDDEPCFVVAEAGVNHDCMLERGYELIKKAKENGADAIKFQTYKAEKIAIKNSPKYWTESDETQYDEYKNFDYLSEEDFIKMQKYAEELGIIFFSTPFDEESADFLEKIGVPMYKIASADITHLNLLKHIAKKGLPMALSTGAATIGEIEEAVSVIEEQGNNQIILLHCILSYPTPTKDMNLNMIPTLKKIFPDYLIGLSDHSLGTLVPIGAVSLGAKMIEKHYTIDKTLKGSADHWLSVDPKELKEMVTNIKQIESALGSTLARRPIKVEEPAQRLARRSIVANRDIRAGEIFDVKNITSKRPGTGINPRFFSEIIGRRVLKDMKEDDILDWEHVGELKK